MELKCSCKKAVSMTSNLQDPGYHRTISTRNSTLHEKQQKRKEKNKTHLILKIQRLDHDFHLHSN